MRASSLFRTFRPIFIAASLLLPALPVLAADITIIVPTDEPTIQAAIDAAGVDNLNSHTIIVEPGTYAGGITIATHPNNLVIKGRETARSVVSGSSLGWLMMISDNASSITIQNLLLQGAANGIEIRRNASSVSIRDCIFTPGAGNTAVLTDQSPAAGIMNNTFYQNQSASIALSRDAESVQIVNNLFYRTGTQTNIVNSVPLVTPAAAVRNNLFYPAPDPANEIVGTNYQPDNINYFNTNLGFVNASAKDFHLRSGTTGTSPARDTGSTADAGADSADGTPTDIGAYGGAASDTLPSRITGVISSVTSSTEVSVSWSPNDEYRIAGYNLYYGYASRTYTAPLAVTGATSEVISGLTATISSPGTPVMNTPEPRNESLVLSWSAVAGATGYVVHYALASAPTLTINVSVGNVTSYTLSGLVNYETYHLSVSAVAQAAVYSAVTASYPSTCVAAAKGPGIGCESAYSDESIAYIGTEAEGAASAPVIGIPEPITAYPDLPDTGCFIATAAYGSQDVLPVRVLRTFRDSRLLTNAPGRAFVAWYYRNSPGMAGFVNRHPFLKPLVRTALEPLVALAVVLTYAPWALLPGALFLAALTGRRISRRRTS